MVSNLRLFGIMVCLPFAVGGLSAEVYDLDRSFETIPYKPGNPTGRKIREAALNLTGVIPAPQIEIQSNLVHVYEGVSVLHTSSETAWGAAVSNGGWRTYPADDPVDNAGFVGRVVDTGDEYHGAYLQAVQNGLYFYPATNLHILLAPGHTGVIQQVLAGSLGDWVSPYGPYSIGPPPPLLHRGPRFDAGRLLASGAALDSVSSFRTDTFYKMRTQLLMHVNDGDCDADGVPDFVDGYDLDGTSGNEDDRCECRKITPWRLEYPEYLDLTCGMFRFSYNMSDPFDASLSPSSREPASGLARIWKVDPSGCRTLLTNNGFYSAAYLGFSDEKRVVELELEAVRPDIEWDWFDDWFNNWFDYVWEASVNAELFLKTDSICSNGLFWANQSVYPVRLDDGDYRCIGFVQRDDLVALNPRIVPDWNRDRVIDTNDFNRVSSASPFRFWINDDTDKDDIADDDEDEPGRPLWFRRYNCNDPRVNGRSDLIDFFPVWLDLHHTMKRFPVSEGYRYRLRHPDNAVRFVYTGLTCGEAGSYLLGDTNVCGRGLAQWSHNAESIVIPSGGIYLREDFLSLIHENRQRGILLMEGVAKTDQPVWLDVVNDQGVIMSVPFDLRLSPVADMYRWVNLRHVLDGEEIDPTNAHHEPDNFPDHTSDSNQFVFVHGYNVSENYARGTAAELFKRLRQTGSDAMFTAVTWFGDENASYIPIPKLYYQHDVVNAFMTAENLKAHVDMLPGTKKYIAAHSLGNMLVSSAIQDHGLNIDTYFMINAAVAMEAYDINASHTNEMVSWEWRDYSDVLWSCEWYQNHSSDDRKLLTWRGRFKGIDNAVNFYSPGDEVIHNNDPIKFVRIPDRKYAWVMQEINKGRLINHLLPGIDAHGGWGFNRAYSTLKKNYRTRGEWIKMAPEEAVGLGDKIKTEPFFRRFYDDNLLNPEPYAFPDSRHYATLLAEAIPATSHAAGANPVGGLVIKNVPMNGNKDHWPSSRLNSETGIDWLHSDFKNIAYMYTQWMFSDIVGSFSHE